jgi:hypothetical protein
LRYEVPAGASVRSLIELFDGYRAAGVEEIAVSLGSADIDAQHRLLDSVAAEVLPAVT